MADISGEGSEARRNFMQGRKPTLWEPPLTHVETCSSDGGSGLTDFCNTSDLLVKIKKFQNSLNKH